jgi:uncharacterized protein (TIGR02145 family)
MKKILLCAAFIAASFTGIAQVGVGTTTPDASAALEIASTTKGFLLPRLTREDRDAIVSPVAGLAVYCTNCGSGKISFYNGSYWSDVPNAPVIGTATLGNAQATVSYTAPADNGGSVITTYTATSSPGGFTGSLSQTGSGTITVKGLANATTYTFTVAATTATGTGAASAASNSVTTFGVPDAPVIGTATLGSGQATVSYTAPANGGSVITTYTATASPGGFTSSLSTVGSGTIIVGGLTNGIGYTFTVTATNAVGAGAASTASNSVTPSVSAPSYVYSNGSGGTYTFLSHNLGADTSLDSHTPVVGLQGGYVQWGKPGPTNWVSTVNDGPNGFAAAPTASESNAAAISGWSAISAPDGSWNVDENTPVKVTANDPCPTGYRVPTRAEWLAVNSNNTYSLTGETWVSDATNYGVAFHYGPDTSNKLLTLPAAGNRFFTNGALFDRGFNGGYWSSTHFSTSFAYYLIFTSSGATPTIFQNRTSGFSVRCIAE